MAQLIKAMATLTNILTMQLAFNLFKAKAIQKPSPSSLRENKAVMPVSFLPPLPCGQWHRELYSMLLTSKVIIWRAETWSGSMWLSYTFRTMLQFGPPQWWRSLQWDTCYLMSDGPPSKSSLKPNLKLLIKWLMLKKSSVSYGRISQLFLSMLHSLKSWWHILGILSQTSKIAFTSISHLGLRISWFILLAL